MLGLSLAQCHRTLPVPTRAFQQECPENLTTPKQWLCRHSSSKEPLIRGKTSCVSRVKPLPFHHTPYFVWLFSISWSIWCIIYNTACTYAPPWTRSLAALLFKPVMWINSHRMVCCKTAQNLLHFISSAGGNCSTLGRALHLFLTFLSQLSAFHWRENSLSVLSTMQSAFLFQCDVNTEIMDSWSSDPENDKICLL